MIGVPFGVLWNSQRAWFSGMRIQPWLRSTPKGFPAFCCQGAAWRQMASFALTHIVNGTLETVWVHPYILVDRYFVKTLLLKIGVGVEALPVLTGITRTTS